MRSVLVTILAFYYRIFYTSASTLHTPATWCLLRVHDYTCLVFFSGALFTIIIVYYYTCCISGGLCLRFRT